MNEFNLYVISTYFMVIFASFLIGCGALFLYYWALPNLRRLGYTSRISLIETQKEYIVKKEELKRLKVTVKEIDKEEKT